MTKQKPTVFEVLTVKVTTAHLENLLERLQNSVYDVLADLDLSPHAGEDNWRIDLPAWATRDAILSNPKFYKIVSKYTKDIIQSWEEDIGEALGDDAHEIADTQFLKLTREHDRQLKQLEKTQPIELRINREDQKRALKALQDLGIEVF